MRRCMRYRQTNQQVALRLKSHKVTPADERAAGEIRPEDKAERARVMITCKCPGTPLTAEAMRLLLPQVASNAVIDGMRNKTAPFSEAPRQDRYVGGAILKATTPTNNVPLDN